MKEEGILSGGTLCVRQKIPNKLLLHWTLHIFVNINITEIFLVGQRLVLLLLHILINITEIYTRTHLASFKRVQVPQLRLNSK